MDFRKMPIDRYAPLGLWLLIHPGIEAANCVNGQQRLHPNTVAAVMCRVGRQSGSQAF